MADLEIECGFVKIAEKAKKRPSDIALQKRSLMYTLPEIVQGIKIFHINSINILFDKISGF